MKRLKLSRNVLLLAVSLLSTVFVACEKVEVDNQKPVISVIEPSDDKVVTPGEAVHFKVMFSDNVALASYKVNIHGAFDNHSHSASVMSTRAATDSIAFEKTWLETDFTALGDSPVAGEKEVTVDHQHIIIPASISRAVDGVTKEMPLKEGHYHFIVYCTDESGQESFVASEIFISYDADGHTH
ncbi:MAG: DUF4625 domain-containing protein [Fermentimonas sp.]|nr:DUF4625 domain-containing protein [Fermentimonas sp.]